MAQVDWNFEPLISAVQKESMRELERSGVRIVADIRDRMSVTPRVAKTVKSRGSESRHHPSQPGAYPAMDLGEYAKRISYAVFTDNGAAVLQVGVRGGDDVVGQARGLEFGQPGNRERTKRPHFGPSWENEMPKLRQRLGLDEGEK